MALGKQGNRQGKMFVAWDDIPRSPGHIFYDRLQGILSKAGFDRFVEDRCASFYASRLGSSSNPPGRYFRMHLVGYFEGIDSERGIEWRCACKDPAAANFYDRILSRTGSFAKAICALARKLAIVMWRVAIEGREFRLSMG